MKEQEGEGGNEKREENHPKDIKISKLIFNLVALYIGQISSCQWFCSVYNLSGAPLFDLTRTSVPHSVMPVAG